jgi:hypothetical protein
MSDTPKQLPLSFIAPIKGKTEVEVQGNYNQLSELIAKVDATGLNNVGTVHFGNFIFLEPATGNDGNKYYKKFALFTFYDGDFDTYVDDFVAHVGETFNALLRFLDDVPEDLIPVQQSPKEFAKYVKKYDQPVAKWYTAYPNKRVKPDITNPVEGVTLP